MICRYELSVTAKCPVDGAADEYQVKIQSSSPLMVEDLLSAVREATKEAATQEKITADLRHRIGGSVTTVGYHSGVRVEVVAL